MDNMELYNSWREPPESALGKITAGRLKGFTDIKPQWRFEMLTERFGVCGFGWRYEILDKKLESGANGEVAAFVDINLYIKNGGEWSAPIPGTGGASFVAKEKSGPHTSDECYKMALTDAISVACKALGMAADVYWAQGGSKYDGPASEPGSKPQTGLTCADCGKPISAVKGRDGKVRTPTQIEEYSLATYGRALCLSCQKKVKEAQNARQAG